MAIIINRNTAIQGEITPVVRRAVSALRRDMDKVFKESSRKGISIFLIKHKMRGEQFCLKAENGNLTLYAGDDLGFIYGIYEISRSLLGVTDFWFWNDQKMIIREDVQVSEDFWYQSEPCAVRYRGWFINDEVLIHAWGVEGKEDIPWEMAFETLLRCGGNMVIPGTDKNAERYRSLASEMGLFITHHHAEPLGAQMFARVYPKSKPSYAEYPERFQKLWKDAMNRQAGMKVLWNLGFRGQGDCPFWADDPQYKTDEARGELLGKLIRIQYDLVKETDADAVCCTNLYGEMMELYRKGYLKIPHDVIRVWADNGYGKMVSRRQDNHNPRVPSLPQKGSREHNGIYYHVSFYDLQAANHITMLPNSPYFVKGELEMVLERGANDLWIINCSNIKPHIYFLDFIARIWKMGSIDVDAHRREYIEQYYGIENLKAVEDCFIQYPKYAMRFGEREDEHAGEQFVNHVPRMLISQFMKDRNSYCENMCWVAQGKNLREQVLWYEKICSRAVAGYEKYLCECEKTAGCLNGNGKRLFEDSLWLQVRILCYCWQGALLVGRSILAALGGEYQNAFYLAGKARKKYLTANGAMRSCEHGKWKDFYANECLTDVKQTAWVLEGMMSFLRNLGDGPHFYKWQRDFLYSEEDRRILLILNMENHLKDLEIFELMEEKWDL